jgi:transketolase
VYDVYAAAKSKGEQQQAAWAATLAAYGQANPEKHAEVVRRFARALPEGWESVLPAKEAREKSVASRVSSGECLRALSKVFPEMVGGSADLTPSNKTQLPDTCDFQPGAEEGRYIRWGVREHAMVSISNGMYAYGGMLPFTATFLNFIQYAFPAVRLAAISQFQQLLIMTHDGIGVGEDGPTHQAIEAVNHCRATPNVLTFRPCDTNETSGAYACAIKFQTGPSVLCLSRQNLPQLPTSDPAQVANGGYVVRASANANAPTLILISTGSEVGITLGAADVLAAEGRFDVRVVSMPCTELFDQQDKKYRRQVLTPGVFTVSVEAAATFGWERYSHFQVGLNRYGLSAPAPQVYADLGLTPEKIAASIVEFHAITQEDGPMTFGNLRTHY